MPDGVDHGPGVRIPPPVMVAGLLALAWLLNRVVAVPLGPPASGLGMLLLFGGLAWVGWAVLVMLRAGNDPRPDKPDTAFVASGPFRFGRNPIYLGFLGVAAGMALSWGTLWGWLALASAFLWLDMAVVRKEEAYLRGRFGETYLAYTRRVRRWL
jgi:protein-S-isoprenylcysteine O-methyltransferase Ste14